jgi:poly-gamma-glutamate synthesis protein (capsule biosynthesis protein)
LISFQSTLIRREAQDLYERFGLDVRASAPDVYEEREKRHFFDVDYYWESVLAVSTFDCGSKNVAELKLYPISLGLWELNREGGSDLWARWKPLSEIRTKLGRPRLADMELGKKIVDRIGKMSAPYGTEIEFKDGVGVVGVR